MSLRLASKYLREAAYFTLVQSQLECASTIWSPWLYKDKVDLEKIQWRAARFVCNNYDLTYVQCNCYDRPTELAEIRKS